MTVRELAACVGKRATYNPGTGLTFDVVIDDVKQAWGRDRYLVRPVAGAGQIWTESIGNVR